MKKPETGKQRTQHKKVSNAANTHSGKERQTQERAHNKKKEDERTTIKKKGNPFVVTQRGMTNTVSIAID